MSHLSCSAVSAMQIAVVAFSALAALLWLVSSFVKMPPTDVDKMPIGDLGNISKAFGRQSRWNAAAALSAAVAAVLQGLLVYAPTCLNLG